MKTSGTVLTCLLAAATLACAGDPTAQDLRLAADGRSEYAIALSPHASATDRFAARELQTFLRESTGAEFPIVAGPVASGKSIELGTDRAKELVGAARCAALADEESVYRIGSDGTVAIAGGGATGNAYGVYTFLERELGCRWFTQKGENLVPKHPALELAPKTVSEKPRLDYRCIIEIGNPYEKDSEDHLFLFRNRINQICGNNYETLQRSDLKGALVPRIRDNAPGCHSLYFYMPPDGPKGYFKDHPEYYTLGRDGRRTRYQLCFSNAALRKELTKNFFAHVGRCGGRGFFDLSQLDAGGHLCNCADCLALERRYGSVGGPLFDYLIELGPQLKARFPDAIVHTLVYHKDSTQHPPTNVARFPDNVAVVFAPLDDDFSKPLDHPNNADSYADLKRWCQIAKVWIWAYPITYTHPLPPFGGLRRSAEDARLAIEAGLTGSFHEHDVGTVPGIGFGDLQTWMLTQHFRFPERDWRALRREFCDFYYGAASPDVIDYEEFLEREFADFTGFLGFTGRCDMWFTPEVILKWQARFEAMERKVGGDARYVQRLREVRLPLDVLTLANWKAIAKAGLKPADTTDAIHARAYGTYERAVRRRLSAPDAAGQVRRLLDGGVVRQLNLKKFLAEVPVKPLDGELAGVAEDRVQQVFADMGSGGRVRRVKMADAATGYALVERDIAPERRRLPYSVGFYDKEGERSVCSRLIRAEDVVPGRFHLYKIGRGPIPSGNCHCHVGHSWNLHLMCGQCYRAGMEYAEDWDVYVSLKFEGPLYDPKSTLGESSVYYDRAVFVGPYPRLADAPHDRGGVSYDLQAMSDAKYADLFAAATNLVAKPWCGTYTNDQGSTVIALGHDRGGVFRVSCRTRVTRLGKGGNRAIMMRIGSGAGSAWRQTKGRSQYAWCGFVPRDDRWYPATATVVVNPGETHAWLRFHNQNSITEIRDLNVHEEVPDPSDALRLETTQITARGGTYEISEGQVAALGYGIVQSGRYRYDLAKMKLRFALPPGVAFVDSTGIEKKSISIANRPDGGTVASVRLPKGGVPESNVWWSERVALLAATRGAGDCGDGWLEADYDDGVRRISARSKPIRFRIGPTIRVAAPKRYMNGIMTMNGNEFSERASMDRYARFAAEAGCRLVLPGPNPQTGLSRDLVSAWRQAGMAKVIAYANPGLRNAIEIGPMPTPPEDRFVSDGGARLCLPVPERTMCPLAVAERTKYYRERVLPWFREQFRGADGVWANWEPWIYRGRGCCCLKCRAAFAKHLGCDESAIAAGWPTNALPGGALYGKAKDFRSLCHARVVKTLDADIREMTGGAGSEGLVPAMCWIQLTRKGVEQGECAEFKPADYAGSLKWVEPWGPYTPNWTCDKPYLRSRVSSLMHFVAAREMRRHADEAYPAEARPKLMAAPQGTTGGWITHPEVFEMAFDAFFFNRHEATAPWVFPANTDAVYWRAFANATARAAKYESFVWDGSAADGAVRVGTVPEYAPAMPQVGQLDYIRNVSFLQTNAYDLKGARIVAAFNTWELGEAFFTLKAAGLAGRFAVVSDDGTLWAKTADETAWTGEELAKGIFLSVGAARTRVFEIVPEGRTGPTAARAIRTAASVRTDYAARKADLAAKAAADRRLAEIEGVFSDRR